VRRCQPKWPARQSQAGSLALLRLVAGDLSRRIRPSFEESPLITAKDDEFQGSVRMIRLLSGGTYREVGELGQIAESAQALRIVGSRRSFWNPQRPYANHLPMTREMKIWS